MACLSNFRRRLKKRANSGLAATEFALLFPMMLVMIFGSIDLVQGFSAKRKLANTVASIAEIAAREESLTQNNIDNLFEIGELSMKPFDSGKLNIVLTGLKTDPLPNDGTGKVHWSCKHNQGTPRTRNTKISMPPVMVDGAYLVNAAISYEFVPLSAYVFKTSFTLTDEVTFQARALEVNNPDGCP